MARGIGIAAEDMQHFTTEEKVAAARRAGIKLVKPQLYENMTPEERVIRTWPCRNCGAGVDEMIDNCLLCGYERKQCTSCDGTGVIDSGPHPVGCAEPCNNCDEGHYYPPVEVNDCAACGDRPAVRDEEGSFTNPRYTHSGKPPVGVCGWCEREGIPV